jgi:DNA adenine methylase Dam
LWIYSEGGGEVSLNVKANSIVYNDKCKPLVNIFKNLDNDFVNEIKEIINKYKLDKWNKDGFLKLRSVYNNSLKDNLNRENAVALYCLLVHAFNYQIAFNSKGEYNMPSGASRSYFSKSLETKLNKYINEIGKRNIKFYSEDFHNLSFDNQDFKNTFYYCDPPYLITVGAYERDYFCKWSESYERELLNLLDILDYKQAKFALSNVLEHKGKSNDILKEWSKKYNVHYLNMDYKNCNYQTKDKSANSSIEVLITNY